MTCYPCTNQYQEVIFFAKLMYLSSHLEKKEKKRMLVLLFSLLHRFIFFMICGTYLQFNPLFPSLVTGFCLLVETILCVSMWQPTAWLDSSSYPSLFFNLFLLFFQSICFCLTNTSCLRITYSIPTLSYPLYLHVGSQFE